MSTCVVEVPGASGWRACTCWKGVAVCSWGGQAVGRALLGDQGEKGAPLA